MGMDMVIIIFQENVMVLDLPHLESMDAHLQIQIITKNYVIGILIVNFQLFA